MATHNDFLHLPFLASPDKKPYAMTAKKAKPTERRNLALSNGKPMMFGSVNDIELAQRELLNGQMISVATTAQLNILRDISEPR